MSEDIRARCDMYPLSQSQMNIWRMEKRFSGLPLNNICCVLNVAGNPDEALLSAALRRAMEKAPALSVRVTLVDGEPRQYHSGEAPEDPSFFDLSGSGESVERWADAMAATYMPVLDAPLYRAAVFRRSARACGVLLCLHHLISDAATMGLLMRAVAEEYRALKGHGGGEAPPMPDYLTLLDGETEYLSSDKFEKDKAFWREQVALIGAADDADNLPVAGRHGVLLSGALARRAALYCERERLSPFLLFAAALLIYRMRVFGEDAPCIGVPVMGRRTADEKRAPGMFVRTLPFLVPTDREQTFSDFILTVNERWYAVLKHERCPYSEIETLAGNRRLFDFALSFQPGATALAGEEGASFEGRWAFSGYQAQRLCLHICTDGARMWLDADYQVQCYDKDDADALVRALFRILTDGLQHPDRRLGELRMLSEEEEDRLLSDTACALTPAPPAPEKMLRDAAGAFPDRAALIAGGNRVSYRALFTRAEALGEEIAALKLTRGAALSIECPRGEGLFIGLCAAILTHTPFLLPDPAQPEDRLNRIRRAARVGAVLTKEGLTALDAGDGAPEAGEEIAYLVATSGSTGEPKLVETPERAFANFVVQMARFYGRGAVLSLCNPAFDAFLIESAGALLNARTVVIADETEMNDPDALAGLMRAYDASFLSMTPSRMSAYLTNERFRAALRHAESLILGGERFPERLLSRLKQATDARIYNQYGPSEAAVCVCAARLDDAEEITCGKPLPGCRVYVLDDALHPTPARAMGEICIGGVCLSSGYRSDAKKTARAFVSTEFEARLFKTGDIGCLTEEGNLICYGRKDGQIKLNGRRVELGEIEAVLRRMPGVKEACVVFAQAGLAAYIAAEGAVDADEVRAFARRSLPRYMVPGAYVFMPALPVTKNGKIDVRALPPCRTAGGGDAPRDGGERAVLSILQEVLKNHALGVTDDFFSVGGDSLTALTALSRLRERFRQPLTLSAFTTHGSARSLAKLLCGAGEEQPREAEGRAPDLAQYPLAPAQRRFYTFAQMDGGVGYNMAGAYKISGALDEKRLADAFARLVKLDEQFRVRFVQKGAEVFAEYLDDVPFAFEEARGDTAEEAFDAFVRPFDLTRAPLLRAAVYHDQDGSILFIDMPHAVSDGLSGAITAERLDELYRGVDPEMPALRYRDYAYFARDKQRETRGADAWREALRGLPPRTELPYDYPEGSASRATAHDFTLSKELVEAVERVAKRARATEFDVLCAAYMLLLSFLTGERDLCVGVPVSGRDSEKLSRVTGPFVNTLPLRARLEGTLSEIVRGVASGRALLLDDMDVEPALLARYAGREDGEPLFQAMFSLLPASPARFTIGELTLSRLHIGRPPLKAPLTMELTREGEGYIASIIYDAARFDAETSAFCARAYLALLGGFERHMDERPEPYFALDAADRARLIDRPRRRVTPCDMTTLYERIEENALLTPAAVAVVTLSGGMTYFELVKRARAMKAFLTLEGVCPGDAVGVMLKRDADLLPALLGVWAAGCAYVPMDESYPPERLKAMVERAGVKLTLMSDERLSDALPCRAVKARFDLPEEPATPPEPEDVAYVLFTSGSTGEPKGVAVPHGALSNLMLEADALIGSCCTVLCATNATFDVFVTETWLPLVLGRTVVMADERQMLLPTYMAALIAGTHVDLVQLTPSRMGLCLSAAAFRANLTNVKRVLLIGEPLTLALKNAVASCTGARIINQYGPTEATVLCSYRDVTEDTRRILIGRPDANCRFYALDADRKPVLPCADGELYIAGACLAKGYVGRDDLTEKAFLPDPFVKGQRMYKTGDRARLLPGGDWMFLERCDGQIKLDGHRIETGEVESAAMETGLIAEAAAVPLLREGKPVALRLFVVNPEGNDLTALTARMGQQLPSYMLPGRVEVLNALPRTPSGKTDRKALTALPFDAQFTARAAEPPKEDWMRALWREALKVEQFSDEDGFFALGGTSLGALFVLNGYFEHGLRMTLEQFYHAPTLQAQRLALGQTREMPPTPASAPDLPREMPLEKGNGHKDGDVLLTGASGFLGAHVLRELMMSGRHVICLTRDENRLRDAVKFYFGDRVDGYEVVLGDVTKPRFGMTFRPYAFLAMRTGLVVHCAADVRHYAADNSIERTNVGGTARAVNFCLDAEAALCHVSTASVYGRRAATPQTFTERELYIGQDALQNAYLRSKLEAEALVVRAMGEGLTAQIMRVGRLVSRQTDGRFQTNPSTNLLYRLLSAVKAVGAMPESVLDERLDMTPVDACAAALTAALDAREAVFHLVPPVRYTLRELARALKVDTVPDERFRRLLQEAGKRGASPYLSSLTELFMGYDAPANVLFSAEKTYAALARVGFIWPEPQLKTLLNGFKEE